MNEEKVIKDKDIKIGFKPRTAILDVLVSTILSGCYFLLSGNICETLQWFLIFIVLGYVSLVDIKLHLAPNWASCLIATACIPSIVFTVINKSWSNFIFMAAGAFIGFLPMFLGAVFSANGIGGADIKVMTAVGLSLGLFKTMIALIIGLLISVIYMTVKAKKNKTGKKTNCALLPFLSVGIAVALFIPIS